MRGRTAVTRQQIERYLLVKYETKSSVCGILRVRVERGGKTNIRTLTVSAKVTPELVGSPEGPGIIRYILVSKFVLFLKTKKKNYTNIRPIRGEIQRDS